MFMFTACAILSIGGLVMASHTGKDRWLLAGVVASFACLLRGVLSQDPDLIAASAIWSAFWIYLAFCQDKKETRELYQIPRIFTRTGDQPLLYVGIHKIRVNGADMYEGRILGTSVHAKGLDLTAIRDQLVTEAVAVAQAMVQRFQAAKDAGDPGAYTHLVPTYTPEEMLRIQVCAPTLTIRRLEYCSMAEFLEV